jgi:hypothetical protein
MPLFVASLFMSFDDKIGQFSGFKKARFKYSFFSLQHMHALQAFEQAALDFIVKYGDLDHSRAAPRFTGVDVCDQTFMRMALQAERNPGQRAEFERRLAELSDTSSDEVYADDFRCIQLTEMKAGAFETLPLKNLPDSDEYVLIDVGSELGRRVTLPFARAKPHVHVVMIDHLKRAFLELPEHHGSAPDHPGAREAFSVRAAITDDVQRSVNNHLSANGYFNVRYIQKKLSYEDHALGIDKLLQTRRVVVTGFKNPGGLGNITVALACAVDAEQVYVTNSALEHINPGSEHFALLRAYLSKYLSDDKLTKICQLMHDNNTFLDAGEKYDYREDGEYYFSSVLKLLFALPQAAQLRQTGLISDVIRLRPNHGYREDYNRPGHGIIASRLDSTHF